MRGKINNMYIILIDFRLAMISVLEQCFGTWWTCVKR